ncbi:MAG: (2Fe-2S)-binding protein [Spirochaetaceae bacterium]|nr:MAG: (2Fe-2S)-binding protein [Spirochaetaceae bacterium]
MKSIQVRINGDLYEREVRESKTLLHFLREDVGLTGTKEGCGAGECGACTIFMNGQTVNSCLVLAVEADGAELQTIEGEAGPNGELSPVQEAFARHHAVQCGFCTPGMVMTVRDLLQRNPRPTREQIIHGIESNFCRCTGYQQIVEAVLDVTGQLSDTEQEGLKYV